MQSIILVTKDNELASNYEEALLHHVNILRVNSADDAFKILLTSGLDFNAVVLDYMSDQYCFILTNQTRLFDCIKKTPVIVITDKCIPVESNQENVHFTENGSAVAINKILEQI